MATADTASIHIDGASRGNPGPAACAYVIRLPDGGVVESARVLPDCTNNVAEYTALLDALERAGDLGLRNLAILSDSELLVKQMTGVYRVKHPDLKPLYDDAKGLQKGFARVDLAHVRREANKRADELCNLALDGKAFGPSGAGPADGPSAGPTPKARKPSAAGSDDAVRGDALACLRSAAEAWRRGDGALTAEAVWDQLWSVLEDGGVLKKAGRG